MIAFIAHLALLGGTTPLPTLPAHPVGMRAQQSTSVSVVLSAHEMTITVVGDQWTAEHRGPESVTMKIGSKVPMEPNDIGDLIAGLVLSIAKGKDELFPVENRAITLNSNALERLKPLITEALFPVVKERVKRTTEHPGLVAYGEKLRKAIVADGLALIKQLDERFAPKPVEPPVVDNNANQGNSGTTVNTGGDAGSNTNTTPPSPPKPLEPALPPMPEPSGPQPPGISLGAITKTMSKGSVFLQLHNWVQDPFLTFDPYGKGKPPEMTTLSTRVAELFPQFDFDRPRNVPNYNFRVNPFLWIKVHKGANVEWYGAAKPKLAAANPYSGFLPFEPEVAGKKNSPAFDKALDLYFQAGDLAGATKAFLAIPGPAVAGVASPPAGALFNAALLQASAQNFTYASKLFTRVVEVAPNTAVAKRAGEFKAIQEGLAKLAATTEGTQYRIYYENIDTAIVLAQKGYYRTALTLCSDASAILQDRGEAYLVGSWIGLLAGNRRQATELFQECYGFATQKQQNLLKPLLREITNQ